MKNFTRCWLSTIILLAWAWGPSHPAAWAQRLRDTKYEHGMLTKGRRVGVWEYYGYTPSGEKVVLQRYDHDTRELLYFRPGPDAQYRAEVRPGEWSYVRLDRPPLFVGGDVALAEYTSRLNYPAAAQARNLQGKVVVAITIDTLGRAGSYRLVQRVGGGCDEEALRLARTLPPEQWVPARLGHRAVATEYELPLNFRLAQL